MVSVTSTDGRNERAAIAIIATGAARALIGGVAIVNMPDQRLLAGVFAVSGDRASWMRVELPGAMRPVRCTMLQTPTAGTALLVDPQLGGTATPEQLHGCFERAAITTGLAGAPLLAAPRVFVTAVSTVAKRSLAGDGRAPVVIAGDAAQTGHVFTGQTCFVNLALALGLCDQLAGAKAALVDRTVNAPALLRALARYDRQSELGAAILAQASARHHMTHAAGAWALAGIANA